MEEVPFEHIRERTLALPEEVQTSLASPEFLQKILRIGKAHQVAEKEEGLVRVVSLCVLGFYPHSELRHHLVRELVINDAQAASLSRDIEAKIIEPLFHATTSPQSLAGKVSADTSDTLKQPGFASVPRYTSEEGATSQPEQPAAEKQRPFSNDPYREPFE